ncbi:hypothetical protein MMC10_010854 [Thelotrema lepadinum]|nr:hypothetical protein [Thelotrema lepadinum]
MALSLPSSPHTISSIDIERLEQNRIWHRFSRWLGRDEREDPLPQQEQKMEQMPIKPSFSKRISRKVVPGLPRPATFRRQNSERRDKLTPVSQSDDARRVQSIGRRRAKSAQPASSSLVALPKLSAPTLISPENNESNRVTLDHHHQDTSTNSASQNSAADNQQQQPQRPMPPPSPPSSDQIPPPEPPAIEEIDDDFAQELEDRWILNLSMHFRDRSPREKFFVTYAETPTRWRRVTVSCDYRDAPPDSLERDLQALQSQREKSARIYEAIRTSLPDIQFYPTVTNLRLETSDDDRLHVHVTEDVNEIIQYPSTKAVQHLPYQSFSECDVMFDSHMSGFVYRVRVDSENLANKVLIKKEIPGPDSVEEFLYEVNALHSLIGTRNVISFEGLVIDEENDLVKGLLIGYAEQGPLIDLIFDFKGTGELTWARKQKWAREIIQGLSEIHEAGFVQGDFTLSNIVVDDTDTAQIIDINRRGCPVGWEPPEIHRMIEGGQRISMYIGVKSDLFQLGMVLWGLAMELDEPEKEERPLGLGHFPPGTPDNFIELIQVCLRETPKDRLSAKDLLNHYFPQDFSRTLPDLMQLSLNTVRPDRLSIPSDTHYIDPAAAVEREDIAGHLQHRPTDSYGFSDAPTYVNRPSSLQMPFDGPGSYIVSRGRSPPSNTRHLGRAGAHQLIRAQPNFLDEAEPQIVPISPMAPDKLDEVNVDSRDWDLIDSEEDDDERQRRQLRRRERMRSSEASPKPSTFEHVDSGLGDMDLVGVGENELLKAHHNALDLVNELDSMNFHDGQQTQDIDLTDMGNTDPQAHGTASSR